MSCTSKKKAKIIRGFSGVVHVYLTNKETGKPYNMGALDSGSLSGYFPPNDGVTYPQGIVLAGTVVSSDNGHLQFPYAKATGLLMAEGEDQNVEVGWTESAAPIGAIIQGVLDVVSRQYGS